MSQMHREMAVVRRVQAIRAAGIDAEVDKTTQGLSFHRPSRFHANATNASAEKGDSCGAAAYAFRPLPPTLPVVFTLRSVREGGRFHGDGALLALLSAAALAAGARWVDVEAAWPLRARAAVAATAAARGAQVIVSCHDLTASVGAESLVTGTTGRDRIAAVVAAAAEMTVSATLTIEASNACDIADGNSVVDIIKIVGNAAVSCVGTDTSAGTVATVSTFRDNELMSAPYSSIFTAATAGLSAATGISASTSSVVALAKQQGTISLAHHRIGNSGSPKTKSQCWQVKSRSNCPVPPVADLYNRELRRAVCEFFGAASAAPCVAQALSLSPHHVPGLIAFDMGAMGKVREITVICIFCLKQLKRVFSYLLRNFFIKISVLCFYFSF